MKGGFLFCFFTLNLCVFLPNAFAVLIVDPADPQFHTLVTNEIKLMQEGKRGLVCQALIEKIEHSSATTTIAPLTRDEKTWHPNDPKGIRSHVVAVDTGIRGGARKESTSAFLYLHPSRIDPHLSTFKLGTFVHELVLSMDLNLGVFSGDFKIREKRANFFRNAWRDSLGLGLYETSGNIPTTEYQEAKKKGFLTKENADDFPILDVENFKPK